MGVRQKKVEKHERLHMCQLVVDATTHSCLFLMLSHSVFPFLPFSPCSFLSFLARVNMYISSKAFHTTQQGQNKIISNQNEAKGAKENRISLKMIRFYFIFDSCLLAQAQFSRSSKCIAMLNSPETFWNRRKRMNNFCGTQLLTATNFLYTDECECEHTIKYCSTRLKKRKKTKQNRQQQQSREWSTKKWSKKRDI